MLSTDLHVSPSREVKQHLRSHSDETIGKTLRFQRMSHSTRLIEWTYLNLCSSKNTWTFFSVIGHGNLFHLGIVLPLIMHEAFGSYYEPRLCVNLFLTTVREQCRSLRFDSVIIMPSTIPILALSTKLHWTASIKNRSSNPNLAFLALIVSANRRQSIIVNIQSKTALFCQFTTGFCPNC